MAKVVTDFFFNHYEKNQVPDVYEAVFYIPEKKCVTNPNYAKDKNLNRLNSVMFVPNYIIPKVDRNLFRVKKINQFFKGYAIHLEDFDSVDAYLKYRFKKNAKSILKKVKRLESCFSISYCFYYGEISKKDYDFFMAGLKLMITNRFEQREEISQNLKNWQHYETLFFNLINTKKASLFVIKNNEEPICISISNHAHGKMFSSVSSYNIDFGKFSLGNIEIYKKLEWCIKNNHNIYELGMGDLSYKREWSNNIYNFEQQIIFPRKSILIATSAGIEYLKVYIKEAIYKLAYVRYKNWQKRNKPTTYKEIKFQIVNNTEDNLKKYPSINYKDASCHFLRKWVNDFLYASMEHENNISVFEISKSDKIYEIQGKSNAQTVRFH